MTVDDKLIIKDLVAECRVGVLDAEQAKPQPIWVDLELTIDAAAAAAKDDVTKAVDYSRLVTVVREQMQRKPYRLLETLAEDVAGVTLRTFGVPAVRVTAKKRALSGLDFAGVDITRRAPGAR